MTNEHKDSKRKEILKAAEQVFIRKGYEKTTMKDIVEETGLSRGGVYLNFSSTEEMMIGLLESMDQSNEDQLDQALELTGGSVWKALELFILQGKQEALIPGSCARSFRRRP